MLMSCVPSCPVSTNLRRPLKLRHPGDCLNEVATIWRVVAAIAGHGSRSAASASLCVPPLEHPELTAEQDGGESTKMPVDALEGQNLLAGW